MGFTVHQSHDEPYIDFVSPYIELLNNSKGSIETAVDLGVLFTANRHITAREHH